MVSLILKKIRQEKGLTQLHLAEILGKPQSFVSKYESEERRLDILEFIDVCEALDQEPTIVLEQIIRSINNEP